MEGIKLMKSKCVRKFLYILRIKPEYYKQLKQDYPSQLLQKLKTIGELHIDWFSLTNGAGSPITYKVIDDEKEGNSMLICDMEECPNKLVLN